MTDIEYEELGSYKPGFLHLKINTDSSLEDLNNLLVNEPQVFSTFLHEYVHFLQNLTTTAGLYQSGYYIQYLKDIVWNIKEKSTKDFEIPLKLTNRFNKLSHIELHRVYIGDVKNVTSYVIYQGFTSEIVEIKSVDGNDIKPKKFLVDYIDTKDRTYKKYHFGSYAIKEYIAHTIQNQFFEVEHPDIPYLIVDQILSKEVPFLSNRTDLKVAICEGSLMCLHPAQFFFETIDRLKSSPTLPQDALSMYDFVHKEIELSGPIGKFTVIELFRYYVNDVIENYSDALKSDIFINELKWLIHILNEAKSLRVTKPLFVLDLITSNKKVGKSFIEIIRKLGTPFFTNDAQYGGFIPPRNLKNVPSQTYLLAAIAEVISVIFGQKGCKLLPFCSQEASKNVTSIHCSIAPWRKMQDDKLCPFCQLWKTYGIYNKKPTTN